MTAEIISSVAEKAVCWCDGREPDSGLSEPRKARGGRGSGQRTCSRQSLLCDRSRVPIRFSAPKTHALVSQWNQYAVVYASSFRSSNLVLSLPSEALLPERLSVQTERGILQRCRDDLFQLWGKIGIQPNRRNRLAIQYCFRDHSRGLTSEGLNSGGHLVEDCPERKQIRAPIELFAAHLLWRHVRDGANRRSPRSQSFELGDCRDRRNIRSTGSGCNLRQAEIQELGVPVRCEKNVRWLDIAMNDAFAVGGNERIGDLKCQFQQDCGL